MSKQDNLSSRLFFTSLVLLVCRFGSFVPIPGIDSVALSAFTDQNSAGMLGMLNMLSGGSLGRMSVFALAIMPYITASIVLQLMTTIYKPLEEMKQEGELGRRKINQLSRYCTVLFAVFQAYGMAVGLESTTTSHGSVVILSTWLFRFSTVVTLLVGTMILMWLGEKISSKGIGNGISLIIFIGIISGAPSAIINLFELSRKGAISAIFVMAVCLGVVAMIAVVIFFEKAQRKIHVHCPQRQVGNKLYKQDVTHLPLKLNTSGVIPPIFASSLLLFPVTILGFLGGDKDDSFMSSLVHHISHGKPLFIILYILLIVFFSFFYTSVVFSSDDAAKNLKRTGAYIPGKRPGKSTAEYINFVLVRINVLGAAYLSFVCIVPELLMSHYTISFVLGGTSFLIVVNVVIDTFTQIQSYLLTNKYDSLLKKMRSFR